MTNTLVELGLGGSTVPTALGGVEYKLCTSTTYRTLSNVFQNTTHYNNLMKSFYEAAIFLQIFQYQNSTTFAHVEATHCEGHPNFNHFNNNEKKLTTSS